jgi:putative endonuclease
MFYVYILYSANYDKYYIGHTENYILRLEQHNSSDRITYTSKYRPWSIAACFEIGETRSEATNIERQLKKLKSKIMLRRIIEGKLPEFITGLKKIC